MPEENQNYLIQKISDLENINKTNIHDNSSLCSENSKSNIIDGRTCSRPEKKVGL